MMSILIFPSKIWANKCALYTAKYSSLYFQSCPLLVHPLCIQPARSLWNIDLVTSLCCLKNLLVKYWLQREEMEKAKYLVMTSKAFLSGPAQFSSLILLKCLGGTHVGPYLVFQEWKKWEQKTQSLTANFSGMWSEKTRVFSIPLTKLSICPFFKPIWSLWFPKASRSPAFYSVGLLEMPEIICWETYVPSVCSWGQLAGLTCPMMCSHRK